MGSNAGPDIERAVTLLRSGGLVAFPTETVYGLGADATNVAAVRRIFEAKGRPSTNPLIVHIASLEIAKRYAGEWSASAQTLAAVWWPGPLTLVVPKNRNIVDEATAGLSSVGLRVPDHPLALQFLTAFDGAVAAPSANRSGRISPTTATHVRDEFGDTVEMILDGGPCSVGIESTVLDLTGPIPIIRRPGGVTRQRIERIIGPVEMFTGAVPFSEAAISPGQHESHYAPATPAYRFETSQRGLIQMGTDESPNGILLVGGTETGKSFGRIIAMSNRPEVYARHLYEMLRELDGMKLNALYIEMPSDHPEWAAVRDRLRRATTPMPI